MVAIPTNARTEIHVTVPDGTELGPHLIEFTPSDGDLVRLYSVDGEPSTIIVETHEAEGDLSLECHVGPHGAATLHATSMSLEIRAGATPPDELVFDVS